MGPLPPPEVLARYQAIDPSLAERIVRDFERRTAIAEAQAAHRQELELRVVNGNVFAQKAGIVCAFLLAAGTIGGGIWLVSRGYAVEGLGSVVTAIAGLTAVFLLGRRRQARELRAKADPDAQLSAPE